jgi:hypothetical protein
MSDPETITWRSHPAAERRAAAAGVGALVLLLAVLTGIWMRGAYWGFFAGMVLFLSLESFFLPTTYELSVGAVGVRKPFSRIERPWTAFRSAWFDPFGVTLSPFGRRHWLETYRGIRLRWGPRGADPSPDDVRRFLLARLDPQKVACFGLPASEAPPAREPNTVGGAGQ